MSISTQVLYMKTITSLLGSLLVLLMPGLTRAQDAVVTSPDKQLKVIVAVAESKVFYSVYFNEKVMIEPSPLGLITNEGDFSAGMKLISQSDSFIKKNYIQQKIKKSAVQYTASQLTCTFENEKRRKIAVLFQVSNNNIAFRYELPAWGERMSCVIEKEATGFRFPVASTTFLSPMMPPMTGFARTAPSYESSYEADGVLGKPSRNKEGYVFPALFRVGNEGWVLVSETGVNSLYCAAHLSEGSTDGLYTVDYPNVRQNNGFGSTGAALSLPGTTPWRTITVGTSLKPVVETTIPFDVVEPLYPPSQEYRFGKSSWSWIVWQDPSMNYDDQVKYIDLAAAMGFEYILMDAFWDKNIGRTRMKELVKYAASKKVGVFLWYNSNGAFNDAPQTPRNKMNTSIERKKEMKWLKETGIKGLKVDFLGGDKQETIRLYEDILSDANDYGLMIIFHGATLPRGWEVMYPNYAGSEAVVASEMLIFSPAVREAEAYNAAMHPFIRNAVGSMEFGGVLLNKFLVRSNKDRNPRTTTDAFQLATAVLYQNPVQIFGLTPNNLSDVPRFELDFLKKVPTTWDETVFIDGYPGKFAVLARRSKNNWYVAGVNAEKEVKHLPVKLPMLAGKKVRLYSDDDKRSTLMQEITIGKNGEADIQIQPRGGFVIE